MKSADLRRVSVPHRNGRSRSKWTEELSCVLNSVLLSLRPIAVPHQTASLFSTGRGASVRGVGATKWLPSSNKSALCSYAMQAKRRWDQSAARLRSGDTEAPGLHTDTVFGENRGKSAALTLKRDAARWLLRLEQVLPCPQSHRDAKSKTCISRLC